VLVSAAIADGPPRQLLEAVRDRRAELIVPAIVLEEFVRVLVEKLGYERAAADELVALVLELGEVVAVPREVPARSGDAADDEIIAAALQGGADILASGDTKHLLPLRRVETMRILRPQSALAEILR
jgi:predicted nucleic acid-binding protein